MAHFSLTVTWVTRYWECHDPLCTYIGPEWGVIESCKWRTSIRLLPEWSVAESCKDVLLLDCYLSEILLRVSRRTCIWQLPEWGAEERGQKESRHAGKRLEDVHDGEWHDLVAETHNFHHHYCCRPCWPQHCQHWDVRHQFTLRACRALSTLRRKTSIYVTDRALSTMRRKTSIYITDRALSTLRRKTSIYITDLSA